MLLKIGREFVDLLLSPTSKYLNKRFEVAFELFICGFHIFHMTVTSAS